jgi:4-alpha-glucanotransferase
VIATRQSGLLLHPTSLAGKFGIGDLGDQAYAFVDFLEASGQSLWQVLPLGPTGYGDSPYQCFSAFAGNPLLVSPERLVEMGLLASADFAHHPPFAGDRVDYGAVIDYKSALLRKAYENHKTSLDRSLDHGFGLFCLESAGWLEDYALFRALKRASAGGAWNTWAEGVARRDPSALAAARAEHAYEIDAEKFAQFLFFEQWNALKAYANERGIRVLGDVPIFVAFDSSDVWAHRDLFELDETGAPTVVAGVPPDYFSETGQLWGNPLYRWDRMREDDFAWWVERTRATLRTVDLLRLDHFRGFAAYWEVPAGEPTAVNGRWVEAPGLELFAALRAALGTLPIIAEDLGVITPDVEALRDHFEFPGMRVLQFAFVDKPWSKSVHIPHNYVPNSVVYTGTHDNETTVGWFESLASAEPGEAAEEAEQTREYCLSYLDADAKEIHWSCIRAVLASVSRMAVIPMQDLLGLGSEARMNRPSSASGNWDWRCPAGALTEELATRLRDMTELYGRLPSPPRDSTEHVRDASDRY